MLFGGLISPIDLDLDLGERMLYWTSNGDMTVSRAPMDPPPGVDSSARTDRQILIRNAELAVGIGLDLAAREVYFATTAGISVAGLDGSNARVVLPITSSLLTGLAVAKIRD